MSPPTTIEPANAESASIYDQIETRNLAWQSFPWRSCLFIGLSLFALMFLTEISNQWEGPGPSELTYSFLVSLMLGCAIYLSFLGGSLGRHWVVGYGLALAVTAIYSTTWLCSFRLWTDVDWRAHVFLACLPGFCFVCLLPYLAVRLFWGWRIMKSYLPPASLLIEDYLITMAIMGSSIALFRSYDSICQFMSSMYFDFLLPGVFWFSLGIGVMVLNLIVLIPLLVVFNMDIFVQRLLWTIGFTVGLLAGIFLILGFLFFMINDSSPFLGPEFAEIFLYYFWTGCWTGFYVFIGMEILRLDGFDPYTRRWLWGTSYQHPAAQANQQLASLNSVDAATDPKESDQSPLESPLVDPRVIDPFGDEEVLNAGTKPQVTYEDLNMAHQRFWVRRFAVGLLILAVLVGLFATLLG